MKLNEIFFGTQEEIAASQRQRKLINDFVKGRTDTIQTEEFDNVRRITRRRFFRQAGLGLTGFIAAYCGFSELTENEEFQKADKPSAPIHTDTKEPTTELVSPVSKFEKISLGPFIFTIDGSFTDEEYQELVRVLEISYPEVLKYIPLYEDIGREIYITKYSKSLTAETDYRKGMMKFSPDSIFSGGIIPHELVHLIHGERDVPMDFIEEGLANAISILVSKNTGLKTWDKVVRLELNDTLVNAGLWPLLRYDSYPPLQSVRYYLAAKFWLEREEEEPGYIMAFHERLFDDMDGKGQGESMDVEGVFTTEVYENLLLNHPLIKIDDSLLNRELTYIRYEHVTNGQKSVKINRVFKKQDTREIGIAGKELHCTFENLSTGKFVEFASLVTSYSGNLEIILKDPEDGTDLIIQNLGTSVEGYKVTVEIDGGIEEFEFSYH
ncbi:hypothetical protein ACFL21_01575 [Patescibacteria group bacterium]